jgi:hypothetical protein
VLLLASPFLLVLAHSYWTYRARQRLDALVATYRAAGEPTMPEDLEVVPTEPGPNAATDLRAAAAAVNRKSGSWLKWERLVRATPPTQTDADLANSVAAENAAAYALADSAFDKPRTDWHLRVRSPTISILLPDLSEQRALTSALSAVALAAHARGDEVEALHRIREIRRVASAMDHYVPCLVAHLVATGQRAAASQLLIDFAPNLKLDPASLTEAQALLAELQDEQSARAGYRRAIQAERVMALDTANEVLAGRLSMGAISSRGGPSNGAASAISAYLGGPIILSDTREMMLISTDVGAASDLPTWPAARDRVKGLGDALRKEPGRHFWFAILMPSYDRSMLTLYRGLADSRLAATTLALRAYATAHDGRLPAMLNELVPTYLKVLPIDPFSPEGAPLRYLPQDPDPRLYSLGENGKDDGGSDRGRFAKSRRWERDDAVVHLRAPANEPTR